MMSQVEKIILAELRLLVGEYLREIGKTFTDLKIKFYQVTVSGYLVKVKVDGYLITIPILAK